MDVFVGNLSPRTTLSDLVTFFKGFASNARFQIHDKQFEDGSRSRYAIATLDPDKLAEKAIKKLNGQVLNGHVVAVREYLHRGYSNERRAMGWRERPWQGIERRASERRRKQTQKPTDFDAEMGIKKESVSDEVDLDNIKVEARDLFARKF
ncbi:MAG TPA: RNA-binding protein [Gammaproteobacteria bacterium]